MKVRLISCLFGFAKKAGLLLMAFGLTISSFSIALAENLKSENFTIQTVILGDGVSVPITGMSAPEILGDGPILENITDSSITVVWKTNQPTTSMVQIGETTDYGLEVGDSSNYLTDHRVTVPNLKSETTYHLRTKSVNIEGATGYSRDLSFTTLPKRAISGVSVSDITYTSAIISWSTGDATRSEVQYGETTNYGLSLVDKSVGYTTLHTVKLENLKPGTEYHFRIVVTSVNGSIERSSDFTFRTIPQPAIVAIDVKIKGPHDVDITWKTNTPTTGILTFRHKEKNHPLSQAVTDLKAEHTVALSELLDNSTYLFQITASDFQGKQVTSDERSFTTPVDNNAPQILNLRAAAIRSSDEIVLTSTFRTNKLAYGSAKLYPKTNPGKVTDSPRESLPSDTHILVKTGLLPSTPYVLKVKAEDPAGNFSEQEISFITPTVRKGIFALIMENFLQVFGWLNNFFGGEK